MNSTEPRVALITGTNRGSGLAIARELSGRGYRIFSLNRTLRGDAWLNERRCDLLDAERIEQAVAEVSETAGRLDVCVSNAVERVLEPIADMRGADWERQIAINLSANFHLTRAALPAMRESRGLFVFMGSQAATWFFEGGAAYSASKAAMKAFTETLLLEERPNGVRACLVSPGAIANLDGDDAPHKMTMESVGRFIAALVDSLPDDMVVGEVEIRPSRLARQPVTGIDRLLNF